MTTLPRQPEMRAAFAARDPDYDGVFFVAVRTTGIFCRPTCPARRPLAKNVEFYGTVREALFAGYRPCKRCRPLEANGRPPEWVSRALAAARGNGSERFRDRDIRGLGIDPARLRRHFVKHYGMTFQAYLRGLRMGTALAAIKNGADLDSVTFDRGYESHSGFREAFLRTFGRPPGQSRDAECVTVGWIESPIGPLVAGATEDGVCLLEFTERQMLETQLETVKKQLGRPLVPGSHRLLDRLRDELVEYFAGGRKAFTIPLVYPGTPFHRRVWDELLAIPYGETNSYEQIARRLGVPGGQRAVGRANGLNRIAILIPCHRVVQKDGSLGGYGGKLWRKQFLLDLERGIKDRVGQAVADPVHGYAESEQFDSTRRKPLDNADHSLS